MKINYQVDFTLSRVQYCALRDYFKRRDGIAAKRLVRMAIAKLVIEQAQKDLAELYKQMDGSALGENDNGNV